MSEKEKEKLSLALYDVVLGVKDTVSLPTHDTLAKTLVYSLVLTFCSLISTLLDFYTFISWQGSLICVCVLIGLLYVERAQNKTLENAYKVARQKAKAAQKKAREAQKKAQQFAQQQTAQKPKATAQPAKKKPIKKK